jgi:hypothetical protein
MSRKSVLGAIILATGVCFLTACSGVGSSAQQPHQANGNTVHPMCTQPQVPICHG